MAMHPQAVIFDIGGVLLDGTRALPGAAGVLERLRERGLPFLLLTNTTRVCQADLLARLVGAGLEVRSDQLITPASMARDWLVAEGRTPMLLIHPGLHPDFPGWTHEDAADAVVVGDAGEGFGYAALNKAFRLLMHGAPLLSLSGSRYFSEGGELFLDAGPFVRLLEAAADARALEMGKPGERFFLHASARLGVPPERVLMIGDDVESDVLGARAAGLKAMLVRTGKYRPGDEARLPPGVRVVKDVEEAVEVFLDSLVPFGEG
ncbi:MAG: TIGR01458 family HAD-type hydrolase [Pseudomonadota bacterium]